MMTRRHTDAPSYNPHTDRRSTWHQMDTVAQRIIAIAGAVAVILAVCGWIARTMSTDARLAALELQVKQLNGVVSDTKGVMCFLARKSDQPILPPSCNAVTP